MFGVLLLVPKLQELFARLTGAKHGKQLFGFALLVFGVLIATGVDESLEAWILTRTPEWLTAVTTKY